MSKLFAHDGVDFASEEVNRIFYHDGVNFAKPVNRVWAHDGAQWTQIFPGEGDAGLPPGDYILGATSLSIPTSTTGGLAEFNTVPYRGRINAVRMRISWRSIPSGSILSVRGRPVNTFYRNITLDNTWSNRTIDHRIDTFNATSLVEFNSGAAIGFNFSHNSLILSSIMTNVQLRLTIS